MTNNECLDFEINSYRILLTSFIQNEANAHSDKRFWDIVKICRDAQDYLEKRKDT